jgi:hypothetical protein
MQRNLVALVAGLCAALAAQTTEAATIDLSFSDPLGQIGFATALDESDGQFTENADGTFSWAGEYVDATIGEITWDLLLDPDPFVSGAVAVTNNTNTTGTFTFEVSLPVTVDIAAGAPMFGSSSISINDANNSGDATVSAPTGAAIYEGLVEGSVVATLFDDPFMLSPAFPPSTASDDASFTGVTSTAISAGDTIALRHTFVLSAGDSATGNSNFTIIPEPSTMVLVTLGGLAVLACRFRSR